MGTKEGSCPLSQHGELNHVEPPVATHTHDVPVRLTVNGIPLNTDSPFGIERPKIPPQFFP